MKEEILNIAKKLYHNHLTPETATNLLLDLFAVSGRSELLVSFLKWYVKDEMMRKEKELITSIVERYLNETNSH